MKTILIGAALGVTTLGGVAVAAQQSAPPADRPINPRLDADGDGTLSREEMMAPADRRFMLLDTDRDGRLSRDEFRAGSLRQFERLDVNRDGRVDTAERQAMRGMDGKRRGYGMRGHRRMGGDADAMPPPPPVDENE